MPVLELDCTIFASLEKVWQFHQDVPVALVELSPPERQVSIERAEPLPPRRGTRVTLRVRDPLGRRLRWVALYVDSEPPHRGPSGEEARFVDEQESGPFAAWRHEHCFTALDESTTRLVDRVTYEVPLGLLGRLANLLFVARELRAMFEYRHAATKRALEARHGES
jgi:ligand-binding SRPBCC domain-containing protein